MDVSCAAQEGDLPKPLLTLGDLSFFVAFLFTLSVVV